MSAASEFSSDVMASILSFTCLAVEVYTLSPPSMKKSAFAPRDP